MSETPYSRAAHPAMERAEDAIDRAGARAGLALTRFGHQMQGWAARARAEAEDIWAEAQSRRDKAHA